MRREGHQHGIVRIYRILPPPLNSRMVNSPTSVLLTKMTSKPTRAHRRIGSGQVHWIRSNDNPQSSYKLPTCWIITGPRSVLNLNCLPDLNGTGDENERDKGVAEVETMERENGHNSDKEDGGSHDDDESMSFYDVGMMMMEHVLDNDDEEDCWCKVRKRKNVDHFFFCIFQ
ncbi:unnamed protein product [Eruca vesicaria subsp. sativa]|uniref:Uncharacterized protein n=1 Tax=Eruca vesicaria subsp. sativa TaxID=29727 RepID=A0ABC8L6Y7_ERUVS|nr:unnamed protein product [Eruca vesicaria subsp. sativa]